MRKFVGFILTVLVVVSLFASVVPQAILRDLRGVAPVLSTLDGRFVVAGSEDGSVLLYRDGKPERLLPDLGQKIVDIALAEDGEEFAALTDKGEVLIWKKGATQAYFRQKLVENPVAIAISGRTLQGARYIAVLGDNKIKIFDLSVKPLKAQELPLEGIVVEAFFRNVRQLTVVYQDKIYPDALTMSGEISVPGQITAAAYLYGTSMLLVAAESSMHIVNLAAKTIEPIEIDGAYPAINFINSITVSAYPVDEKVVVFVDNSEKIYLGRLNLNEKALYYVPAHVSIDNLELSQILAISAENFAEVKTKKFSGTRFPFDKSSFKVIVGTADSLAELQFSWATSPREYQASVVKNFKYYGVSELLAMFITFDNSNIVALDGTRIKVWNIEKVVADKWAMVPPSIINVEGMRDAISVALLTSRLRVAYTDGDETIILGAQNLQKLLAGDTFIVDRFYPHKETDDEVKFVKLAVVRKDELGTPKYYFVAIQTDGVIQVRNMDGKLEFVSGEIKEDEKVVDMQIIHSRDFSNVYVLSIHQNGTVKLWNLFKDELIAELKTGLIYRSPEFIAVSPDGGTIAIVTDRFIRLYKTADLLQGKAIAWKSLSSMAGTTSIAFSSNDTLAIGRQDGVVVFVSVNTGKIDRSIEAHNGKVLMMRPAGKFFVTYGEDGAIKIW